MAVASPSSPETLDPKSDKPDPSSENTNGPNLNPDLAPPQPENPNPDPNTTSNPNPNLVAPPPPPPSFAPSFRPLVAPPVPQYSIIPNPNPNFSQNPSPGIQPPGVSAPMSYMVPGMAPGPGSATVSAPPMRYPPPNAPPMAYGQVPNGYMAVPPPGIPHYPGPYPNMVRPGFPPRPLPPMGVIPQIPRPPIHGVRGIPPVVTPLARPVVPPVAATEKPQTTVYVGKIAPTVENEFLLSLLRLCGPVKSWKRPQNPTDGSPKGFGFCEFEAAEGILRALRLLNKLNIDGQELMLNINQATREYLERYVEKKTEREKLKETDNQAFEKEDDGAPGAVKQEPAKPAIEEPTNDPNDSEDKENQESEKFGIVTDEDRETDKVALEKITSIIEERLKTKPLPPPPPPLPVQTPVDGSARSNSEVPPKSRDGDSDVDIMRSEDKNDDENTSAKLANEHDKPELSSPDRGRKYDRSSRERDKERDLKRDEQRELQRYERDQERERVRREKERDLKIREAERLYNNRLKEWEAREREKEHQRLKEKEREKNKQRERRREISKDEDGSDDDDEDARKRRRRGSTLEERRRKRQREKEDDLADRLKEEEELTEAKKRAIEEQQRIEETKSLPNQVMEESETVEMQVDSVNGKDVPGVKQNYEGVASSGNDTGDLDFRNCIDGQLSAGQAALPDMKHSNDAPARKLGFGLVGSGKRTSVPSVFHEEDDENVDEKKMRPLVPIDYSMEELQAVQSSLSSTPPNLVAAAEFAKRISGVNPKEEKPEMERDRNGRSNDRASHRERERERNDDENTRNKIENKEKRDRGYERERDREDKPKSENKKLLDAKQLIDMIPKTKEELFAYEINWAVYDKHELHEKMRPWISKKITEFLGEEEETLVDYIVSSTKDHVRASKMLDLLQSILDDEAEMFVLKMWRMLIFEIKRVETGLSLKPKT